MLRIASLFVALAAAAARTRVGGGSFSFSDSQVSEKGSGRFFATANVQSSSIRIEVSTNIQNSYDNWELHTGPAAYCSAQHFNGGAWPFTKVFDGPIYSGTPFDSGVQPGAPAEKFCIVFKCDNAIYDCKGIDVDIDLYASSPDTQQCDFPSNGPGVFPDPITSVAKESDVNPSWRCAVPLDNGTNYDHHFLPLVTVAPVPGGPVETLRWCQGASVCLPRQASATSGAVATPTRQPESSTGSSCPSGMVPHTGPPGEWCFSASSTFCSSFHSNNARLSYITANPPATVDNTGLIFTACGTNGGNCGVTCNGCTITCVTDFSAPAASPTRTPTLPPSAASSSPTRTATPTRTPTKSPSRAPTPTFGIVPSDTSPPTAQAGGDDDDAQSAGGAGGGTASGGSNAQRSPASSNSDSGGGSTGAIVGAVVGVVAVAGLAAGGYWYYTKQQQATPPAGKGTQQGSTTPVKDFHMMNPVNAQMGNSATNSTPPSASTA